MTAMAEEVKEYYYFIQVLMINTIYTLSGDYSW